MTLNNIAIIGANGALGTAFAKYLSQSHPNSRINAFSREKPRKCLNGVYYQTIDYSSEPSIEHCAKMASKHSTFDLVIVATGILHDHEIMPEKSLKDLSASKFTKLFDANTITPALIGKHFLPRLSKDNRSVFAALSARVGSISDNHLGGWYAYRASKAALNMVIKTAAIETTRGNKHAIVVGLHPGTVDSPLSKPFQSRVPSNQIFSADESAQKLLGVLRTLTPEHSGKCLAWDGSEIAP